MFPFFIISQKIQKKPHCTLVPRIALAPQIKQSTQITMPQQNEIQCMVVYIACIQTWVASAFIHTKFFLAPSGSRIERNDMSKIIASKHIQFRGYQQILLIKPQCPALPHTKKRSLPKMRNLARVASSVARHVLTAPSPTIRSAAVTSFEGPIVAHSAARSSLTRSSAAARLPHMPLRIVWEEECHRTS
jgi:hypothetical protein